MSAVHCTEKKKKRKKEKKQPAALNITLRCERIQLLIFCYVTDLQNLTVYSYYCYYCYYIAIADTYQIKSNQIVFVQPNVTN